MPAGTCPKGHNPASTPRPPLAAWLIPWGLQGAMRHAEDTPNSKTANQQTVLGEDKKHLCRIYAVRCFVLSFGA